MLAPHTPARTSEHHPPKTFCKYILVAEHGSESGHILSSIYREKALRVYSILCVFIARIIIMISMCKKNHTCSAEHNYLRQINFID